MFVASVMASARRLFRILRSPFAVSAWIGEARSVRFGELRVPRAVRLIGSGFGRLGVCPARASAIVSRFGAKTSASSEA